MQMKSDQPHPLGNSPANASPASAVAGESAPPLGMSEHQHLRKAQNSTNRLLSGILGLLLLLVGGVIFVLPDYIGDSEPAQAATPEVPAEAAQPAVAAEPAPFAEAQRLRLRQQAQDALAPLLDLQGTLEKQQVQQWAGDAYAAALATAQQGDAAYSTQQFEQAMSLYQQALTAMQRISTSIADVLATRMAEGTAALAAGDSAAADAAYSVAILLDPNSSEAVQGIERAHVLDQVLALMDEGESLQANGQFDDARDRFQQAASLDPAHEPARKALSGIATAQANQNFAAVMSRGFVALQAGDAEAAKTAFEQAGNLRPGSPEVAAALQQAKDQETLSAITVQINAANAAEASEDWAAALAAWNAALAIDPNLVDAQNGQKRTQSRNNLDQFLVDTIANPLRLGDDAVLAQTTQVMRDASTLLTPGPKLQRQLQQVQEFIARIKVPVNVTIQSDGLTNVTLNGVSQLGLISSQTLSLAPGTYVAVGVREGYRDVRQEIVVGLDGQSVQVTVACNEAI